MASGSEVPEVANWVSSIAVGIGLSIAAAVQYLRKPKPDPSKDVAVVSATLVGDKPLINRLIAALEANTEATAQNNALLQADAQQRLIEERAEEIYQARRRREED
ncbi:MAG: hypothetical protein VYD90_12900 [Pseudomonadota bacterium]|nr:hypothetical protein [Pseudomonadota bacterium]